MVIEKFKINHKAQKQNLKSHETSHKLRLTRTHVFKILNAINIICGENCES